MSDDSDVDFGPLTGLIGEWQGAHGVEVAPEPDGSETNPYFETITFSAVGGVTNAEAQNLAAIHYHQIVHRKSDSEVFHNETGHWMWDKNAQTVMHSLAILRAVCVLAGAYMAGKQTVMAASF